MRGKARANLGYGNKIGITPAYAGKSDEDDDLDEID